MISKAAWKAAPLRTHSAEPMTTMPVAGRVVVWVKHLRHGVSVARGVTEHSAEPVTTIYGCRCGLMVR